jgi:hypothetical protein
MTSIIDTEQVREATIPSNRPKRSTRSIVAGAVILVVLAVVTTLGLSALVNDDSSAPAAPVTTVSATPDLVERWAESSRLLLEACRRGEVASVRGMDCPPPTAPGFRPGHQGGQPRNAN